MPQTTSPEKIRKGFAALKNLKLRRPIRKWLDYAAGTLGQYMVQSRSPDGTRYPPLKRPRPPGHNQQSGPLIDFGDMLRSLIADGTDHIEQVTNTTGTIGTRDEKAAKHQYGINVTHRPFVGVNDEMADEAAELIADEVMDQLDRMI